MICPNCQAENKEGAKFCNECGTPLALRCPRCGAGHRQGRREEAKSLLDEATETFRRLEAGPALARAETLGGVAPSGPVTVGS